MSNVVDLVDQIVFLGERATGTTSVIQSVWTYDRGVDMDGLRRFHHHLLRGRLSRRIERSPLPFGRHRWVAPGDRSELEIVETPRPRDEFDQWLNEQAATPARRRARPGMAPGGAAVHRRRHRRQPGHLAHAHRRRRGVPGPGGRDGRPRRRDRLACSRRHAGGGGRCWPTSGSSRATCPASGAPSAQRPEWSARNRGRAGTATPLPRASGRSGADEPVTVPMATVVVDVDEWDARARALGGTSNSLLAGLAARLAQRMGRVTADGSVTLAMPVNDRAAGDTRANAVTNVDITVDPAPATTDLREIRAAIKQALIRHQDVPNERWALLPLVPLLPKGLRQANGRRRRRQRDQCHLVQPR